MRTRIFRTFGLFAVAAPTIAASALLSRYGETPALVAGGLMNVAAFYALFTVLHEASHGNISRRRSGPNNLLGGLSAIALHGSFPQFARIHTRHYAHTNHPDRDPDYDAFYRPGLRAFITWSLTAPLYFFYDFKNRLGRAEPKSGVVLSYSAIGGLYAVAIARGFGPRLIALWTLPSLAATALVVYVFDHLAHRPHHCQGRYTHARDRGWRKSRAAEFLSLGQAFHVIHHLWPSIP